MKRRMLVLSVIALIYFAFCGLASAEGKAEIFGAGRLSNADPVSIFAAEDSEGVRGHVTVAGHLGGYPKMIAAEVVCFRIEGEYAWITAVPLHDLPDNIIPVIAIKDNGKSGDFVTVWWTGPPIDTGNPADLCAVAPEQGMLVIEDLYLIAGDIKISKE